MQDDPLLSLGAKEKFLSVRARLSLPVFAAPMFIISHPAMVIASSKSGIVGSFPALNARPQSQLDEWLFEIKEALTPEDAPFAVNQIVHKSNKRLETDLALCVKHKVPIVISSLGAVEEVNQAVHSYGGMVFHDVIHDRHAKKAIEKGADGLIAVAAGAGGHAGTISPFALVSEIRSWFDGPLLLAGAISNGSSILSAIAMGADCAYIGSPLIATYEARAGQDYKDMIINSKAKDIVYSDYFTGVHGNYLRGSIENQGLDPDNLPKGDISSMALDSEDEKTAKSWKDIWGCGQGIGGIDEVISVADRVKLWQEEFALAQEIVTQKIRNH